MVDRARVVVESPTGKSESKSESPSGKSESESESPNGESESESYDTDECNNFC